MNDAKRASGLAVLWEFVHPHRWVLGLALVLGLASTGASLALPMVTKRLLDTLGTDASLTPAITLLVVLLGVGSLLGMWQWILLGTLAERVVLQARTSMVRRYFGARPGALNRRSNGELVTRVTSDTVMLREAASSGVIEIINSIVMLVGTIVLMAVLDRVLLLTTVAVLLVVGVVVGVLLPRIGRAQELAQASLGELGGTLEGALRAVRTVKANCAEDRQVSAILGKARDSAEHSVRAVRVEALTWTAGTAGAYLSVIAVLAIGAWRIDAGLLSVSSLVAFLLYAFGIVEPITSLAQELSQLQAGTAAARRIRDVQQLELEEPAPTEGCSGRSVHPLTVTTAARTATTTAPAASAPLLALKGVTARHLPGGPAALSDVSLELPHRGRVAIVGPSGAGKTTLFALLLRFLAPQRGTVELEGTNYEDLTFEQVRRRFAYVEQDSPVVPGTLRENLVLPSPSAPEEALWNALAAVRLAERARTLPQGLDTSLSAAALSGGERQRVALARAVLHAPDALLLDEATAQLDGITEAAVHDVIADLARNRLVITIAHRLSTVIDADLIVVVEAGRIRASGTHEQLLEKDGLYRELITALRITTPNQHREHSR
ncbi:ABC transporter ATP-binding protein/permease [Paenibacillus sp. TRM 82003]|uniref:ABC transporter ATP-binding protein n=1 Tax=Kineococcus sp. TRM81007 TaxID=2925831 RepID=UPI001F55F67F|nr:ABC transporter ATP-binding protein [Kineococcus sp. TRM81007]MCI2240434.1 ABC transporter ATP-binding protein/permease [Kineococcus sp. TRM81007]MCI3927390.1 ABC transporter ATP-binding protein/permease [Paenibacillus sp. TRM 82003]